MVSWMITSGNVYVGNMRGGEVEEGEGEKVLLKEIAGGREAEGEVRKMKRE